MIGMLLSHFKPSLRELFSEVKSKLKSFQKEHQEVVLLITVSGDDLVITPAFIEEGEGFYRLTLSKDLEGQLFEAQVLEDYITSLVNKNIEKNGY